MTQTVEERRAKQRKCRAALYAANPEKFKAVQRAYCAANRDKISARAYERRTANLEEERAKDRARRAANHDRSLSVQRAWHAANRDRVLAQRRKYNNDPSTWTLRAIYSTRSRAKRLGIPFDLQVEDIHLPAICPFTLLPFHLGLKNGKIHPQSPSLDRIKPDGGYVRGNVRVISFQANAAKSNITDPDVFQRLADDARLWSLV